MHARCPKCGQALNLAGITVPQVQCPACHTLINVPAGPTAAPLHAPAMSAGSVPPGGGGEGIRPSRVRRPNRQRGWQSAGVFGGLVLVVGVVGAVAFVTWKLTPKKDRGGAGAPAPLLKVQEAIADRFPKDARFAETGYDVRQIKEDEWSVKSHVDIKGRDGVIFRKAFSAFVRREAPDQWHVERVEIAGQRVDLASNGSNTNIRPPDKIDFGPPPTVPDLPAQEDRTISRAMRRLAEVLGESVELRKTLVVWLFDASPSAGPWRDEVRSSFDRIYQVLEKHRPSDGGEGKLQLAAAAFDSEVRFLLDQPTSDPAKIRNAIDKIDEGKSGSEMPFAALAKAAEKFASFRQQGGYVQFVVVTDEAGDDSESVMDQAISTLERQGMQVYVIGKEAPFGRSTWPKGSTDASADPRREGPETINSERINLQFWQRSFLDNQIEIPSSFGPYWLSRLCQKTGGTFFICDGGGNSLTISPDWGGGGIGFDPKVRAKYAPRYISGQEYRKFLASNKAAQALVDAGKQPFVEVIATLQFEFLAGDEAGLRRALDAAQKGVARLEPKLEGLYQAIQPGEGDRGKLTEPRWQAGFDLAMGRILATKGRVEGYNAMVALLKQGKTFKNKSSSVWVLEPSDTIGAGSKYEGMIKSARKYLERVVQDHPGTPWAKLAERELSAKLGWEWGER
jgi:hypothetical protein